MDKFLLLLNEMSPYLLLGFLLAGLMHAFIPGKFYAQYLSANNFKSVVWAALFGVPLPLCSCGVIPTAMSLRKEGASKGAVVSFLIATPQTGVDSIIATYGLMGLPFAIMRPIAALVTALFGGMVSGKMSQEHNASETANATCSNEQACSTSDELPHSFTGRLVEALKYGYFTMMQDIGKWLMLGLVIAALITIFIPTEWFTAVQDNTLASMLLILLIAVPMYVCATGSIPIAVALMMKGLTPGAALVLLMAGPACNVATMVVVKKVMGTRTLITYLLSITVGAIAFGCLIDYLQFHGIVDFLGKLTMTKSCCHEHISLFSWICSGALALLLINALLLPRLFGKSDDSKTSTNTNSSTMQTIHIEGMMCNHCRMTAEKAILGVKGVTSATVDLQQKEAQVEGSATFDDIRKAIEEVGFTCSL